MTTESTPAAGTNENITAPPPTPVPTTPAPPAPAASDAPPPAWILKSDYVLLGLLLLLSFLLASFTASNSDLWLHLAIGQRLSEGTFTFGVDPFSWATEAVGNKPAVFWVHHSWLYSWFTYYLFQLTGPSGAGLVIAKAILFTATIALLSRIGWTEANRWFVIICLLMAALAMHPRLNVQPVVVSFFFLAVTLFVLNHAGVFAQTHEETKPDGVRWLWGLPPLFALWANLDVWFILGPMVLGLCWAATGLGRWFTTPKIVPGKTLGLVFGVGLLACLVNPFHVRVFQLPPELAYLVLTVTDTLGLPLPSELLAAGRTLKELCKADPTLISWANSTLSSYYLTNAHVGMNIAGLAFFPLLLLGVMSFTLTALVKPQPGAPTLHPGRLLLWLVFAVLALALYRLIPFFVVIAAPLTAMTLGEFLLWQQKTAAMSAARRDRGLSMARFVSVPFVLLLLFMAWPGWIKGPTEYNAPNRVAWQIRPDGSELRAAETLHALKQQSGCGNVFNASFEMGNYLPWFAPDLKYFMDTRLALYADRVGDFVKAKEALSGEREAQEWQALFKERNIDQIVMVNFMRNGVLLRWWLDAEHWRQRYCNDRIVVLSWAGPDQSWPVNRAVHDWNRQAFGTVPTDRRPPRRGTITATMPSFWTLYLEGIPPRPAGAEEANLLHLQFRQSNAMMQTVRPFSMSLFHASLCDVQGSPGGNLALEPISAATLLPWSFRPLDFGPPALPILMVRTARRALDENPQDPVTQLALLSALETMRKSQEDYWIGYDSSRGGPHPAGFRDRLRQYQLIANYFNLTQLQPKHPHEPYKHHLILADLYGQQNLLDLALDHQELAVKALEAWKASDKDVIKGMDARIKEMQAKNLEHEKVVRQHIAKWKEQTEGMKPLEKAYIAYYGGYPDLRGKEMVKVSFGLGKQALEILGQLDPESLDRRDFLARLNLLHELLLATGRADALAESLKSEDARKDLPPQLQLYIGGALGDYELMDAGLAAIQKTQLEQARMLRLVCVAAPLTPPSLNSANFLTASVNSLHLIRFNQALGANNEVCNTITLRGILALEAGDTDHARQLFQYALTEAGDALHFSERPIAQRYFDLLEQQRKQDQ